MCGPIIINGMCGPRRILINGMCGPRRIIINRMCGPRRILINGMCVPRRIIINGMCGPRRIITKGMCGPRRIIINGMCRPRRIIINDVCGPRRIIINTNILTIYVLHTNVNKKRCLSCLVEMNSITARYIGNVIMSEVCNSFVFFVEDYYYNFTNIQKNVLQQIIKNKN